jgi:peptide chain release factor 2
LRKKIADLEAKMNEPDFWNDTQKAQKITKEINLHRLQLEKDEKLSEYSEELDTYFTLLTEELQAELFAEAQAMLEKVQNYLEQEETQLLLNEKTDSNSAILVIHPGAGGTESQDWAEMLLRMYLRWAENEGYKTEMIDLLPGDEAGIKSATVEILGDFAYGFSKAENGIHRLVRISPFNAQGKRQTSFASVYAYPIIDEEVEIEIDPKDLRIDTYRSSGKGGQSVNTTDSAVRITHIPTNIVVQCQNERSQIKNRDVAMQILKSRLYQLHEEEKDKERQKVENTKTEIGWGNQIRSYVFHPYQMVKDHRTNHETGNANAVINGDVSGFMKAFLKYKAEQKLEGNSQ